MNALPDNHADKRRRAVPGAALALALGLCLSGAAAQDGPRAPRGEVVDAAFRPFAWPWQITPKRIHRAMARQSYEITQVRRFLDRSDPRFEATGWVELVERLRHLGATRDADERFRLDLVDRRDRELKDSQRAELQSRYESITEFLFRYQSFRIADPKHAAENYRIRFLGITTRLDRPVYRVAVVAKNSTRSSWQLDLDMATGYPLYRGEFDASGELVAEVEVTRYDPSFDGAFEDHKHKTFERYPTAAAALQAAGFDAAVPAEGVLPAGYRFMSARFFPDLLGGGRHKVTLTYTDGVDQLFFVIDNESQPLGAGHIVQVYRDETSGTSQCLFVHEEARYLIIGRGDERVKGVAMKLYSQAVLGE